jgi:hypothetical protein
MRFLRLLPGWDTQWPMGRPLLCALTRHRHLDLRRSRLRDSRDTERKLIFEADLSGENCTVTRL